MKITTKIKMRLALWSVLSVLPVPCMAGPPFNVDDPGTAEYHRFNLYAAYVSSQNSAGEQQALPGISMGYGYNKRLELDLSLGVTSTRSAGSPRLVGFGDVTSGVKWRFLDEKKQRPQLSLGYQMKIPTADTQRGLGTGTLDNTLWFSGAKSFGRWVGFTNVGYNFLGGRDGKNNLFLGIGLTYQLTEKLIVGAQVYGNSKNAPGTRDELAWGLGLTYNYAPDRSLLLAAGRSEHGFSDLNVYAGLAFTFGR